MCDESPQSGRDHGTMISEIVIGSQEKSSLEAAIFRKLLCDSPPGGMIFLRRNINTLPHGFPSLSEIFQLVRALRQVSPDGDSFTPSDWPVTGPLAGPLTVSWLEFRSVEGLHPPGIFNSNEKRIRPSAAVRKRIHFGDWPVYCRLAAGSTVAVSLALADTASLRSGSVSLPMPRGPIMKVTVA